MLLRNWLNNPLYNKDKLQPILDWAEEGQIPNAGPAMDFVKTKHSLALNYCVNVLTYVMFKTKKVNLKLHPLTKRLVQYKQLLDQLAPLEDVMNKQIDSLLKSGPSSIKETSNPVKKTKKVPKKLNILTETKGTTFHTFCQNQIWLVLLAI